MDDINDTTLLTEFTLIWIESIHDAAGMWLGIGSEIEVLALLELRVELAIRANRVCALSFEHLSAIRDVEIHSV